MRSSNRCSASSVRPTTTPALLGRALEAGRITLFEYLTEYNIYLDGAADYASLLADYATALARLQRYVVFSDMTND